MQPCTRNARGSIAGDGSVRRQVLLCTGRSIFRSRHHVVRNAHRHRSSDAEKRCSLDRFKKDTRLTYAAADDATKASLHHYTKRTRISTRQTLRNELN